jgi:hypothetical protein
VNFIIIIQGFPGDKGTNFGFNFMGGYRVKFGIIIQGVQELRSLLRDLIPWTVIGRSLVLL